MKKVAFNISTLAFLLVFAACKKETHEITSTALDSAMVVSESESLVTTEDLLVADAEADATYLYVTATSGLSLREYSNLHSHKLARMPYGTKVKVIQKEPNNTMNIAGINGGMDEVEFNHKKGFAFNGYLSKYFPPERDISVKGYASELQALFSDVIYSEEKGGTVSNPTSTESIVLPGAEWHEAFVTAQRLFDFPKEFTFPNPTGKASEIINDGKPKKGIWVSQLEITRVENTLAQIAYVYGSQKFDATVTISQEGSTMKISKTEVVK